MSAVRFCVEGVRRCNAPDASEATLIVNRKVTSAERAEMGTKY